MASLSESARRKAGILGDAFRQQGAGFVETFLGSPEAEGFEKAIPNFAFGLAGLVNTGINRGVSALGGPENFLPAESLLRKHSAGVEQANRLLGVEDPANFVETLNRIALPALVPSPKIKEAGAVTKAVTEFIAPGLQTRSVPGAVGAVAIPFVASEAIVELADIENYTSILDVIRGNGDALPTAATASDPDFLGIIESPPDPDFLGVTKDSDFLGVLERLQPESIGDEAASDLLNGNSESDPLNIKADDFLGVAGEIERLQDVTTTEAAVSGLVAAMAILGGRARSRAKNPANLTGTRPTTSATPPAVKAQTGGIDKNRAITYAVERATDPETAADFASSVRTTITPQALSARIRQTFVTGEFPNSSVKMPRLVIHLDELGTLSTEKHNMYDAAMLAGTKMDDLVADKTMVWKGSKVTFGELEAQLNQVNIDPQLVRLRKEALDMFAKARDYMLESGIISSATKTDLDNRAANFVPTSIDLADDDTVTGRLMNVFRETEQHELGQGFSSLLKRGGDIAPGEARRPSAVYDAYFSQLIRFTEQNRIRRDFFRLVDGSRGLSDHIKVANGPGTNTVAFLDDGTTKYRRVDDDFLRTALKFHPAHVVPILNGTRRVFQFLTTGTPGFVPISWAYDIQTAPLLKMKGRRLGPADELLGKVGLGPLPIDPSVVLSPVTGTLRAAYSGMVKGMEHNLELSLRTGGTISRLIGPDNTKRLANTMMRAYENSSQRLFEKFGGGNAPLLAATELQSVDATLAKIAPRFAKVMAESGWQRAQANAIFRGYVGMMHAFHNAIRLQHFAANRTKLKGDRQLTRLAADTRRLTGDASQIGGNKLVQQASSSLTYANVATQVTAEHARAFKRNHRQYIGGLMALGSAGVGLVLTQTQMSEEARDHYWNKMTPSQRAARIPIFDTNGEVLFTWPVDPLFRLYWSPLIEGVGTVFGLKHSSQFDNEKRAVGTVVSNAMGNFDQVSVEELRQGFVTALGSAIPDPVPPVVGAGIAALGGDPNIGPAGRHNLAKPITEKITPHRNSREANSVFNNQVEGIMSELLGAAARPLIDSINAFNRVYDAGGGTENAAIAAGKRFLEPPRERFPFSPVLWGVETQTGTHNATQRLLSRKRDAINEIGRTFSLEERNPGGAGRSVRSGNLDFFQPTPSGNPQLDTILNVAAQTNSALSQAFGNEITQLRRKQDAIRANPHLTGDPTSMKIQLNDVANEIRELNDQALRYIMEQEDFLSEMLGRDFRFENFDADELR